MPGFSVHHQLPELAQTHVYRVGDAIQPSHLLSSSLLLPSVFPSIRVFSSESILSSGGQSIGTSASVSDLPMNVQDWFPLGLIGLISFRDSHESIPTPQFKSISSSVLSFPYNPTLTSIHDYWKNLTLTRRTFVDKIMFLLFNMLSRFLLAFLPRSKDLFISWLLQWSWSPRK